MLLSDGDLRSAIGAGWLEIDPLDMGAIQPSSVDVRLDHRFRRFVNHTYTHIDPLAEQDGLTELVELEQDDDTFILHPGEFALGSTVEQIGLADTLAGRFEGKSSLGRLGLVTHSTAGFVDPGFSGQITLELSNVNTLPIKLYPGMKIGQLCVFRLSSPAEIPYGDPVRGSRYNGQDGPTESRYWAGGNQPKGWVDA